MFTALTFQADPVPVVSALHVRSSDHALIYANHNVLDTVTFIAATGIDVLKAVRIILISESGRDFTASKFMICVHNISLM